MVKSKINMKLIVPIIFVILSCGNKKEQKNNNEVHNEIKMEYSSYIGKTINEFIVAECDTIDLNYYIVDDPPGKATSLVIVLNNDISVELFVDKFNFMNPFDMKRVWDFEKYKKEEISKIILFRNDTLINEWE